MSALFAVELRRFLSRRLVRVIAILAVAGMVVAGMIVFARSSKTYTPPDIDVQVLRGRLVECSGPNFAMSARIPEGQTPEELCNSLAGQFATDPRFHLTSLREGWLAVGAQLIVVAWLVGASFAGAEWHTGNMTTLLTWEPRRTRVFVAKAAASIVLVYLGAVLLEIVLGAALLPAAVFRGTTAGADGQWLADAAGLLGRVGFASAVGASLGLGLAMVGRNTAASLGVGFGYLLIVENLIRGFRPQWGPWLLGDNTAAFLGGAEDQVIFGRSTAEAGAVIALYAAVALLAGWLFFRRRDVT